MRIFWKEQIYKHFVILVIVAIQLSRAFHVMNNKNNSDQHKRRYLSDSGLKKVRRYLSRKYHETHKDVHNELKYFSNTWAVHVDPPQKEIADRIAKRHGFTNIGKVNFKELYCNLSQILFFFFSCIWFELDDL